MSNKPAYKRILLKISGEAAATRCRAAWVRERPQGLAFGARNDE